MSPIVAITIAFCTTDGNGKMVLESYSFVAIVCTISRTNTVISSRIGASPRCFIASDTSSFAISEAYGRLVSFMIVATACLPRRCPSVFFASVIPSDSKTIRSLCVRLSSISEYSAASSIPRTRPQAIASYNYVDIADGTGIIVMIGYGNKDSVGITYILI